MTSLFQNDVSNSPRKVKTDNTHAAALAPPAALLFKRQRRVLSMKDFSVNSRVILSVISWLSRRPGFSDERPIPDVREETP